MPVLYLVQPSLILRQLFIWEVHTGGGSSRLLLLTIQHMESFFRHRCFSSNSSMAVGTMEGLRCHRTFPVR